MAKNKDTQRCPKHGTFSGNVGCPWCKEKPSEPAERPGGVSILNSAGTGRRGAEIVSKATSKQRPEVETRIVGHAVMGRTKRLADDS